MFSYWKRMEVFNSCLDAEGGKIKIFYIMNPMLLLGLLSCKIVNCMYTEEDGRKFMWNLNKAFAKESNSMALLNWEYECDMTEENEEKMLQKSKELAKFEREKYNETIQFPWQTFNDSVLRDQFHEFSLPGMSALSDEKFEKLDKLMVDMEAIYSKAKICDYHNPKMCNLSLEPEITEIMTKSRDEKELRHVWIEWRKASGEPIRELFPQYVDLENEVAVLNNFTDIADFWLDCYEMDNFEEAIDELWHQVRPLYLEIHAYVRRKLRKKYGEKLVSKRGPIPAHLLGNMWGLTWNNIADFVMPYPNTKRVDITKYLVQQNYTSEKIYRLADQFFISLNLTPVPDTFWERSVLEKIPDREMVCHASAWDFCDGKDYRIKQCTRINEEDFFTAHHEMGHIQYYMQYRNQPYIYQDAANPGFHEAIGDVIGLSVSTPKHLHRIGILPNYTHSRKADLNYLFNMALEKIVFLPFGYSLELWRWKLFRGEITKENYTSEWWKLRDQYQGIVPPVKRTEKDFDPGSKFHIAAGYSYIEYFVSFIIQFQFHEALCVKAGQYDPKNPPAQPFHQCDIYQSKAAGNLLGKMLSLGLSKRWPDAMELMTGQKKMDAGPLLRYFAPIYEWLKYENNRTGEYVGWISSASES